MTDYHARVDYIRTNLSALRAAGEIPAPPPHLADQFDAANSQSIVELRRLAAAETLFEPDRWDLDEISGWDHDKVIDLTARVMAAMGDGERWRTCMHLKRTPAQPAYLLLAIRRTMCKRCVATTPRHRPPRRDDDRCDLCGARGLIRFWPLRMHLSSMLVLGDTCRECAAAIGNPDAKATPA